MRNIIRKLGVRGPVCTSHEHTLFARINSVVVFYIDLKINYMYTAQCQTAHIFSLV